MLQLWDDVISLDDKIDRTRRLRVGEAGSQTLEIECGRSFVEEESEMVGGRSMPRDGDEEEWDFCDIRSSGDGNGDEWSMSGGSERDKFVWVVGEAAWWKFCW